MKTRQQALLQHLLNGFKLSNKNAYLSFGITNISREVGRLIEKPLNIVLNRKQMTGKTIFKKSCYWFEYDLKKEDKKTVREFLKGKI